MNIIEKILTGALGRFIRTFAATAIGGFVAKNQNQEWYILIAPLIAAGAKKLRDKYPGVWEWLPF